VLSFALAASFTGAAADERRITNAANVRLRSSSSTDAPITAELPLGTELVVLGQTNAAQPWYHVKTDDGREGWVLGSLTTSIDPGRREQTIESIVEARLHSGGNFSSRVQLFDFIERTAAAATDPERQSRLAWYRLRSMADLLESIPFRRGDFDPYRAWIRGHLDASLYNEPAGQWMVHPDFAQAEHDRHRGSAAADDIAWFYVTNAHFGECEGSVPCYVSGQNERNGWYLRSHPSGRYVDESTAEVARVLNEILDYLQHLPAILAEFDPKTSCGELHASLDPLTAAVTASTSTKKSEALAALDRYAKLCR
jgi:hypothetical protein